MDETCGPHYDLEELQLWVRQGFYNITIPAADDAGRLGFTEEDILDAVLALQADEFYKTMLSEKIPGLWQDVYRTKVTDKLLYVKLQASTDDRTTVISFKEK